MSIWKAEEKTNPSMQFMTEKIPFHLVSNLSAVMFHIINLKFPVFEQDAAISGVPRLSKLMQLCWQKEPESRLRMDACIEHLEEILQGFETHEATGDNQRMLVGTSTFFQSSATPTYPPRPLPASDFAPSSFKFKEQFPTDLRQELRFPPRVPPKIAHHGKPHLVKSILLSRDKTANRTFSSGPQAFSSSAPGQPVNPPPVVVAPADIPQPEPIILSSSVPGVTTGQPEIEPPAVASPPPDILVPHVRRRVGRFSRSPTPESPSLSRQPQVTVLSSGIPSLTTTDQPVIPSPVVVRLADRPQPQPIILSSSVPGVTAEPIIEVESAHIPQPQVTVLSSGITPVTTGPPVTLPPLMVGVPPRRQPVIVARAPQPPPSIVVLGSARDQPPSPEPLQPPSPEPLQPPSPEPLRSPSYPPRRVIVVQGSARDQPPSPEPLQPPSPEPLRSPSYPPPPMIVVQSSARAASPRYSPVIRAGSISVPSHHSSYSTPRDFEDHERAYPHGVEDVATGAAGLPAIRQFENSEIRLQPENGSEGKDQAQRGVILETRKTIAIKPVNFQPRNGTRGSERALMSELNHRLRIWGSLEHENITKMLGSAFMNEVPSVITEWCTDGNIMQYLKKTPQAHRRNLLHQAALGLKYLQTASPRAIHSNLKPENVLVDGGRVKLADIGILEFLETQDVGAEMHGRMGDARWTAPEILEGHHRGWQSDIYSFGCLALLILRNELPYASLKSDVAVSKAIYRGDLPINREAASGLHPTWKLCWAQDPQRRPDISAILESLEAW
ncbi:hypothetical protein FRC01_013403 [Tulasnella sp. 417]|nr:hypothetical protein FRC01_013403 [Tulasnella sp. 417]